MNFQFLSLGLRDYQEVLHHQLKLRSKRQAGEIEDTIITVQHPPVITEGRRPAQEDYQVTPEMLEKQGIATAKVNRGGRLTYHGPGQLVAYYIISLKERGMKVPAFVRAVEETALLTLSVFGVRAARRAGCPGVWVNHRKIASIGLAVDRGVSMHGMALNIDPQLEHFRLIVPCGMPDCEMTSLKKETGKTPTFEEVEKSFIKAAHEAFFEAGTTTNRRPVQRCLLS